MILVTAAEWVTFREDRSTASKKLLKIRPHAHAGVLFSEHRQTKVSEIYVSYCVLKGTVELHPTLMLELHPILMLQGHLLPYPHASSHRVICYPENIWKEAVKNSKQEFKPARWQLMARVFPYVIRYVTLQVEDCAGYTMSLLLII